MRVWLPRGISRRMSSTGGWSRRPGAAGLGGAGLWVPVELLLGLVVIHPVRERRACCWRRIGCLGPQEEDHVL